MRMAEFIKQNRQELNVCINGVIFRYDGRGGRGTVPNPAPKYNDKEIREWILNDEGLYNWARSQGVRI